MRITLSLSLLLTLLGCSADREVVWVDLDAASQLVGKDAPRAIEPPMKDSTPPSVVSIRALPPPEEGREAAGYKRRTAVALAKSQFDQAFRELLEAYRREGLARARVTETALRNLLLERARTARTSVVDRISKVVERHAAENAPVLVRLALLAGWPDSGHSAFIRFARTGDVEDAWRLEAEELRKKLLTLESAHADEIAGILAGALAASGGDEAVVVAQIQELYRRTEEEAMRRAKEKLAEVERSEFRSLLSERGIGFSGQPSRSLQVGSATFLPPATQGVSEVHLSRKTLNEALRMWLRVNGYELSQAGLGVRDATPEFVAWFRP